MDFRTGELVKLTRGPFGASGYTAWSPDSRAVALWRPTEPGIEVFDRSGRRLAELPIHVKKRSVVMSSSSRVTVFDHPAGRDKPRVRFTTYDLKGARVATTYCALPSGYPPRATAVDDYDGDRLWIHALVDSKRYVYRHSIIDTSSGSVIEDIQHSGTVPYIDQWVRPGVYLAGVSGAPDGVYAVDSDTAEMVRLSQLELHRDQEGYENHANSQFARDLVFDGRQG